MKKNKVIHIVLNNFLPDYRVLKETTSLANAGFEVIIFALKDKSKLAEEYIGDMKIKRFRLYSRILPRILIIQSIKLVECYWHMLRQGIKEKPQLIHAHDLNALIIGYLISLLTKGILIYDSHEHWASIIEYFKIPMVFKKIICKMEGYLAQKARLVITVSGGIGKILEKKFHIPAPLILKNVPEKFNGQRHNELRRRLGAPDSSIILLYVGDFLPRRGLELLLTGFSRISSENVYLVFLGARSIPAAFVGFISENCRNRVLLVPPVHPRKVVEMASSADIGLYPIRGVSKNHNFCLPNKFFQYIQAGLAVLVTDLPEMAALVKAHNIGKVFEDGNVNSLVSEIQTLIDNEAAREQMKLASQKLGDVLCWENEEGKLIQAYENLIA